jgi:predicted Zn finger-like uncharacterized protein
MLPTRVACPHCRAALKTSQPLAEGQRVKCPSCGTRFTIGTDRAPATAEDWFRVGPPPQPAAFAAEPRRGISWTALALILVGGLAFVGGGIALAVFCFSSGKPGRPGDVAATKDSQLKPASVAGKDKPGPDKPAVPANAKPGRPRPRLFRGQQVQVNQTVARGLAFLRAAQNADGTWTGANDTLPNYPAGMTALAGLTLLECGAKKDDPDVAKVADYLRGREQSPNNKIGNTYEISLAILFFDRLGDPKDKDLIPRLGLRLVAGQNPSGGWTYTCPVLADADSVLLARLLDQSKGLFSADPATSKLRLEPVDPAKLRLDGGAAVPATLAGLAVWQCDTDPAPQWVSDNSNTQFAVLGLWAAKTRGVPVQRSLALLVARFHKAQNADGSWGYGVSGPQPGTPSMTCAGLLGLAVGQGLVNEARGKGKPAPRPAHADPAIKKGLAYLARQIDNPHKPWQNDSGAPQADLYFTWSVERVGVIFGLPSIGGKDWYGWGAEKLVANQKINGDQGNWLAGGYFAQHPVVNTCFALLFLKQANLAKDLTAKLQLAE